jgi:hypothetical protein
MSSYENAAVSNLINGHKQHKDFLIALTVIVSASFLGIVAIIVLIIMLTDYISKKVVNIMQSDGLKSVAGSLGEGVARGVAASLQMRNQKLMATA